MHVREFGGDISRCPKDDFTLLLILHIYIYIIGFVNIKIINEKRKSNLNNNFFYKRTMLGIKTTFS